MTDHGNLDLEALEAQLRESMLCRACAGGGITTHATHVLFYRAECLGGGKLDLEATADLMLCTEHAQYAEHTPIEQGAVCHGCGRDVGGEHRGHIVDRIVPLEATTP